MHIHIIGIAGVMTTPLAKQLKNQGHIVTGSDQTKIYPPFSNILQKQKISVNKTQISKNIDLVIVGSSFKSFSNTTEEFKKVKKLKLPYISATKYISKFLKSKNSILVAGSYGKTTITSLLSWIFVNAKLKPNYMFGGSLLNKIDSLKKEDKTDWSILEADESINGLDTKAKFLYYQANHLIITSSNWEHKESYKTERENFSAFKKLIKKIPKNGIVLINKKDLSNQKLIKDIKSKLCTYNTYDSDYSIIKTNIDNKNTLITIKTPKGNFDFYTSLIGKFNFENILAAIAISLELKINLKTIQKAVATYKGIKRRLELVSVKKNIYFYDDFAQSSERIKQSINAIKLHFPKYKIKVFFEPHASFLQSKEGLNGFDKCFQKTNEIVFGKISFSKHLNKKERVTINDFKNKIGNRLIYFPLSENIKNHYLKTLKTNSVLIHMSSGGLEGLKTFKKIINNLIN